MTIRVFIVDDHKAIRDALKWALASPTLEIIEASDGQSALHMLIDDDISVDVVLLDVHLPDLSGLEVLRHIRLHRPHLPVLMHSCRNRAADIERAYLLGAVGYLLKSPDVSRVHDAISTVLAGKRIWTDDQRREISRSQRRHQKPTISEVGAVRNPRHY